MFNADEIMKLRKSYIEIGRLVQRYGNGQYNGILTILMGQIRCIDSDSGQDEKRQYLVDSYKRIFMNPRGLSDFIIYDTDSEKRKMLNEKFYKETMCIWTIVKPYITVQPPS